MENEQHSAAFSNPHDERPVDEFANLVTHAGAFLLTLPASLVLMQLAFHSQSRRMIAACGVYCMTLVALYAASALSHLFHDPARRRGFRTLDQACIFLLIAGSFTPLAVAYLGHGAWPLLLATMWIGAALGVVHVVRVGNLTPKGRLSYGLLGWMPVVSLKTLIDSAPPETVGWFVAGGLFYTAGTLFLCFDRCIRYLHALWHAFVIAGSVCHYLAILASVNRMV